MERIGYLVKGQCEAWWNAFEDYTRGFVDLNAARSLAKALEDDHLFQSFKVYEVTAKEAKPKRRTKSGEAKK